MWPVGAEAPAAPPRGLARWLLAALVAGGLLAVAPGAWAAAAAGLLAAPLAALAAAALSLLPGLALLRLLWPDGLALDERLCLALCLSPAAPPLALLLSDLAGLRWGGPLAWGAMLLCAAVALWPARRRPGAPAPPAPPWAALGLLAAALSLTLALRFGAARGLVAGQFGDSYHHTIIAQLLVDNGGLFRSWQPYAPLATFTYHFGFHTQVAGLSLLGGYPVTAGVLAVTQLHSGLAGAGAYLLALRLGGGRQAALWAALLAGLAGAMPAYYVNWGRATQLAGQAILPGVCVVWAALIDGAAGPAPRRGPLLRLGGLAAVTTAGLALTHYRVAIFAACFVAVYGLYALAAHVRSWRALGLLAAAGLGAGAASGLLVLPWLLRLREGALLKIGGYYLSQNVGNEMGNSFSAGDVALALPLALLAPAALGVAAGLWPGRRRALTLAAWGGLVWVAANPFLVGLNGAGIISSFAALIAAYLALAPLGGVGLAAAWDLLARAPRLGPAAAPAQLVAGLALAAWAAPWQLRIVDPAFQLYTPADAAAMAWLREETPADARVFVNAFPVFGGTLYAGSDGGWWVAFEAGRQTNLPPYLHGQEAGERPDYQRQVAAENAALLAAPIDSPAAARALRAAGYRYLYDGPARNPPAEPLDPARIDASPLYERVYGAGGVSIWAIRP